MEKSIMNLDKKYLKSPSTELYKQQEMNLLGAKQKFYEHGDKAGRMLTHQLRKISKDSQFTEINIGPDTTEILFRVLRTSRGN